MHKPAFNKLGVNMTPYALITAATWGWMYSKYLHGINITNLTPALKYYVFISFWGHFILLFLIVGVIAQIVTFSTRRYLRLGTFLVGALGAFISIWLFVDSRMYSILNLHANRFILEAVIQPNAISHIGIDPWSIAKSSWPILLMVLPHLSVARLSKPSFLILGQRGALVLLLIASGAILIDKLTYGYLYFRGAPFVFELKNAAPIYPTIHTHYTSRFYEYLLGADQKVGFMQRVADGFEAKATDLRDQRFYYPYSDQETLTLKHPKNVIFIVAESLRANDFNEHTAPFLWNLMKETQSGSKHYSSSNCTHFGIFSLLYGLNPWYFQDARSSSTPPVGLSLLESNEYAMYATLSRSMQWYDLDKVIFNNRFLTFEPSHESNVDRDMAVTQRAMDISKQHAHNGKYYFNSLLSNIAEVGRMVA